MSEHLLIKGFIIGFSIAAPVGPIGVLCIRRTLVNGRLAGLLSGLGAATADAVYGAIAGFGLTVIAGFLLRQQSWLSLGGGLFLFFLGLKTAFKQPAERLTSTGNGVGLVEAYASTFLLTLTNPATILAFVAIFAGLGLASGPRNYASATLVVLGVFAGSALWWLVLSGSVSLLRSQLTPKRLRWVNRLSGLVITLFGLFILFSLGASLQ
jgi:threonine/homoserine/homoserine lactone efflux protein